MYEWAIDIIWLLNIVISFCTPFTRDVDKVNRCSEIAEKYLKSAFLFDVISTIPCVATLYDPEYIDYTYLTKILRVYHLIHCSHIIQHNIIDKIVTGLGMGKQSKEKTDFSANMLMALCFVMHVIACMWLWVGVVAIDYVENERYHGSWIDGHLSVEQ
jgi:hypothetical protein